ncbi:hypothetical protein N0V94_002529 [Neodidymelliopsis sp. IMI 364377]|nr:hypothetical protein N0V94_002529 [Neodidymelliopsis sp. IMI 364377]
MPAKWTAELDSILLHGVFEECQISFGKALCEKIAERVRAAGIEGFTECTPKAVENRLYSWKKKNVKTDSATGTPTTTPKKPAATPKKAATPRTPRAKKNTPKKKVVSESEEDDDEGALKSPSAGRKRKSASMEGAEGKKMKVEASENGEDGDGMGGGDEI